MSLKSIKNNYTSLLKMFSEMGVTINESQKKTLDNFIVDLEKTMNEQRDNTIRATKKIVEEKLEADYRTVVESIIKHQAEHSDIAGKIQEKAIEQKNLQKMVESVDMYLDKYVEEILPKKTIVDYARMQKLEQIQESLKDLLMVKDSDIQALIESKVKEEKDKLVAESAKMAEELKEVKTKLTETKTVNESIKKKYNAIAKKNFINESIKDLPKAQARKVSEKLQGMDLAECKTNLETVVKEAEMEITEQQDKIREERNLEEAIKDIVEGTGAKKEPEPEENPEVPADDNNVGTPDEETNAEPDGTRINESVMQNWIDTLMRITPKK